MADEERVLLLTRPEPQSRSFLADCRARLGHEIASIVSPVMRIDPVPVEADLDRYATLIVTSRNALDQVAGSIGDRTVRTVGQRTADHASMLGADAVCLGDTVEAFLERADEIDAPAVHLRGVHSRGDLAARMTAKGIEVDECVVYDQVEQPLSDEAQAALAAGQAVVPIFSPRTSALVSAHGAHPETVILAISDAAAAAWGGKGRVHVARRPDKDAILDLVAGAF